MTSYIPTYLSRSLGASPLAAGAVVAAITVGWPIAATVSGRFYLRIGFRRTALVGLALVGVATAALAVFAPVPSFLVLTLACLVAGFGFGLSATPAMIVAQSSVPWSERGVVTGNNQFSRSVGSAVGIAAFGAVANALLAKAPGGVSLAANVVAATGRVFWVVFAVAVVTLGAAWAMPKDVLKKDESGTIAP